MGLFSSQETQPTLQDRCQDLMNSLCQVFRTELTQYKATKHPLTLNFKGKYGHSGLFTDVNFGFRSLPKQDTEESKKLEQRTRGWQASIQWPRQQLTRYCGRLVASMNLEESLKRDTRPIFGNPFPCQNRVWVWKLLSPPLGSGFSVKHL